LVSLILLIVCFLLSRGQKYFSEDLYQLDVMFSLNSQKHTWHAFLDGKQVQEGQDGVSSLRHETPHWERPCT
jgi:hypothetical protein